MSPLADASFVGAPPASSITLMDATLGLRFRPFGAGTRAYAEVAFGGQWATGQLGGGAMPADVHALPDAWYVSRRLDEAGMIGRLRLGANLLPSARAGLFADVGYEFPLGNPDHDWLVPLRVGVELP